MPTPAYPASLPGVSTFILLPDPQGITSDNDAGPKAMRRRSRQPTAQAQVTFRFLEADYSTFVSWWKDALVYGHKWFTIDIPSAGGITEHYVRFADRPRAALQGHRHWELSVTLEIRDRQFAIVTSEISFVKTIALCVLFNEANESTTPASIVGPSLTRYGTPTVSSDFPHFSGNTYKNTAVNSSSSFRTSAVISVSTNQDFTLEGWAYRTGTLASRHVLQLGSSISNRCNLYVNNSGILTAFLRNNTAIVNLFSDRVFPAGRYVHVAVSKAGDSLYLHQDGVCVGAVYVSNLGLAAANMIASIGTQNFNPISGDEWNGYIDDVIVSVGRGRYSLSELPDLLPIAL